MDPQFGGAINNNDGTITINNCIFTNNIAGYNGGAIASNGTATITNSIFTNNTITRNGGAINNYAGTLTVKNCTFYNNYAGRDGAAIAISKSNTISQIENSIFINNEAGDWAGAIYNWMTTTTVKNCTFINNTAELRGGALLSYGYLTLTHSIFYNNSVLGRGGAIATQQEYPDLPNTLIANYNVFVDNKAYIADDIFIDQRQTSQTNFNNNWWGVNNPTTNNNYPQTWNERYNDPGNYIGNPTNYLTFYLNADYQQVDAETYLVTLKTGLQPTTNTQLPINIEIDNRKYTQTLKNGATTISYIPEYISTTITSQLHYEKITKNLITIPKPTNEVDENNNPEDDLQVVTSSSIPMQNTGLPVLLLILGALSIIIPSFRRK